MAISERWCTFIKHIFFLIEVRAVCHLMYFPSIWTVGKRSCLGKVNIAFDLEVLSGDLLIEVRDYFAYFGASILLKYI